MGIINYSKNIKNSNKSDTKSRRGVLSFLVRFLVSTGLIVFLLSRVDTNALLKTIREADYRLFALALVFSFLKQGFEITKLFLLVRAKGINVPLWNVAKIMITSTFLGTFAPTSLGTEVFRAYGFSRYTSKSAHSVSAVAVNRFLSMFALMFLASISSLFEREYADDVGVVWIAIIFAIPVFLIAVGFVKNIRSFFKKQIFGRVRFIKKAAGWVGDVGESFYDYRHHKGTLSVVFILSSFFQIARVVVCYLLAVAIGVNLPVGFFFIFIPLVLLFTMIPLSVGGIGMREGGVVYFLGKAGIGGATAFSVSILWFLAAITSSLPGLFFYLAEGIGLKRGKRNNKNEDRQSGISMNQRK